MLSSIVDNRGLNEKAVRSESGAAEMRWISKLRLRARSLIRAAATWQRIVWMILSQGLRVALYGVGVGLIAAVHVDPVHGDPPLRGRGSRSHHLCVRYGASVLGRGCGDNLPGMESDAHRSGKVVRAE
jgi:hypothetical protein